MENIIRDDKRQKLNRPITGIIHKDRIWEQWYDQDIFNKPLPKMLQKDYLFENIKDDPNRVIINNRGMKKFTVDEFSKMVLTYEKAFSAVGLQVGDVICTVSLTTPEMYAIKYAATSLGLITCNLNVLDMGINDDGKNRLYNQIKNVSPKMIFTLDILEDKIYPVINDREFDNILKVSMPLEKSTPIYNPERLALGLKKIKDFLSGKKINGKISLDDFIFNGKYINEIEEKYSEGQPCNISFTSGTTGINKAVLLSHDANNALAYQHIYGNLGFPDGTKHLALVPPFLAFWDADIVHVALCLRSQNILELSLDYDKIPLYFKKYKPNVGIWSQYLWSSILTLPDKDLKDISSKLERVIVGGERCEINAAEKFYNKTNVLQTTGFGASEVNTTFSVNHPNCNKIGTAGLPLPFNNVKIIDESGKDLGYNKPGKLFITGPCLMNGYYKRDDLTKNVIHVDKAGTHWYYTGDYAFVDTDGCLTVLDRYSEPINIISNGKTEKINVLDIVEVIKRDRVIKNCKITHHDSNLVLHVSFDNEYYNISTSQAIYNVIETIRDGLSKTYWPDFIKVYDELPRTSVGKVDYKKLSKIGENICSEYENKEKLFIVQEQTKKENKILQKKK